MLKSKKYTGLKFVLPFFVVFLVFQLYPILYTFFLSFNKYDGFNDPEFVGFENYLNLFQDKYFWLSFLNTWKIWLPNIILQLVIALLVAVLFTNYTLKVKFTGFFRAVFYFPNLVTAASIALLFNVLLDWQNGAVNQLLFGADKESYVFWMNNPGIAQMAISLIQTWMWFGYSMILFVAGLMGIPKSYYEAASIDGASSVQAFFKITLPQLRPIIIYVVITSLIGGMQLFDIPQVITDGSGEPSRSLMTAIMYMYNTGFRYERFGYAASVSYLLFVMIIIFSVLYLKFIRRDEKGEKA